MRAATKTSLRLLSRPIQLISPLPRNKNPGDSPGLKFAGAAIDQYLATTGPPNL
jgi:hypothetical protein